MSDNESRISIDGQELTLIEAAKYVADKLPQEQKRALLRALSEMQILEASLKDAQRTLEQGKIALADMIRLGNAWIKSNQGPTSSH